MFSRFFIERPIFASVISIVIVIAGVVAFEALPVAQYPEITPPTVEVKAAYPGANAKVVAETVAAPIEQEVNGVENMIYMSSTSASDGSYISDGHLRSRHRPGHGPGAGTEPGQAGRAQAAGGGQPPRDQHQEEIYQHSPDGLPLFPGRPLRRALPQSTSRLCASTTG